MTSEWSGTAWAGTPADRPTPTRKAVTGPTVIYNNPLLSSSNSTFQAKAHAYLQAYKVGWFYKAGSRISRDLAGLEWCVEVEDEVDGDTRIEPVASNIPFADLPPVQQLLRLLEKPNPHQSGLAFRMRQQIRLDFTGRAMVYLENGDGGGLPTALYGVSPSRMWPSYDAAGQLIGWVMDRDKGGRGIPFSKDEILVIEYPGPDDEPVGVVEAVFGQIPLGAMIAQHTADVLATGGRLAGMAWPRDRALSEDEFTDAQRAWRNVTSDPNAARRLLLFPEPMEYVAGAATPAQIGIPELATLSRDEILTAFPIHPFLVGVPLAAGLNSGDSLKWVKREYWEGTLHPRVEIWEDAFQQQLVPRYEAATGMALDLDIDEPELDDAADIAAKADAMGKLVALGFDPAESASAVGLDGITLVEPVPAAPEPAPMDAADPLMAAMMAPVQGTRPPMAPMEKAAAAKARRETIVGEVLPGFTDVMREALRLQADHIIAAVTAHYGSMTKAERVKAAPAWWNQQEQDGFLRETMRGLYLRLAKASMKDVASSADRTIWGARIERITDAVLRRAGERITGINETTRDAVQKVIDEGVRRGLSVLQIANGDPKQGFAGIRDNSVFGTYRAEMIARTETMLGYNQANLEGYREFGIEQFEAIDGDGDLECEKRDGQVVDADTMAQWIEEEHPNGTLDFAPVWPDKARHESPGQGGETHIHVEPYRPAMKFTVVRDEQGRIAGIREEPA